ncbi:hypothetical protein RTBOTA2_005397 [Rhodotorula toruloides]|nr:hypothetical protein RTBOTA2_005397 [Rhodotorula toruloides]
MSATNVHGRRPTTLDPLSPTHPPSLLPAEGRFSPAPPTSPASPASTPITLERGNDSPVLPLPRDPPSSASSPLVPWESTNCDKDVTDDEKEPLAPTGVKEFSAADWEEPTKPRTSWWRIWVKATVVTLLLVALIAGIAVGITEASKSLRFVQLDERSIINDVGDILHIKQRIKRDIQRDNFLFLLVSILKLRLRNNNKPSLKHEQRFLRLVHLFRIRIDTASSLSAQTLSLSPLDFLSPL